MMQCRDTDELVVEYLYEELDAAKTRAIEAHADGCARCHAELASLKRTRAAFSALPAVEPPASVSANLLREAASRAPVADAAGWLERFFRPMAMHPAFSAAAAFVLIGGVAGVLALRGAVKPDAPTRVASSAAAAAATPATPATPAVTPAGAVGAVGASGEPAKLAGWAREATLESAAADRATLAAGASAPGAPAVAALPEATELPATAAPPPMAAPTDGLVADGAFDRRARLATDGELAGMKQAPAELDVALGRRAGDDVDDGDGDGGELRAKASVGTTANAEAKRATVATVATVAKEKNAGPPIGGYVRSGGGSVARGDAPAVPATPATRATTVAQQTDRDERKSAPNRAAPTWDTSKREAPNAATARDYAEPAAADSGADEESVGSRGNVYIPQGKAREQAVAMPTKARTKASPPMPIATADKNSSAKAAPNQKSPVVTEDATRSPRFAEPAPKLADEGGSYGGVETVSAQATRSKDDANKKSEAVDAVLLHGQARAKAASGDCPSALVIKRKIFRADPAYYGKKVKSDPVLARCDEPARKAQQRVDALEAEQDSQQAAPAKVKQTSAGTQSK